MEFLEIDGSYGEGGGQLLRTAIALSCITNRPVKVHNIRGKRPNPGLQHQHMTALRAAVEISKADVKGLSIGSTTVFFKPGEISGGKYEFDIKTAGSVTLVMQAILPILCFAKEPSEVTILGGTDVPWSPTIDYFKYVVIENLRKLGIDASVDLIKRGHYPKGGGKVILKVKPVNKIVPISSTYRGNIIAVYGISHCTNLPNHIAIRQAKAAINVIKSEVKNVELKEEVSQGLGPGSGIALWAEIENGFRIGADALGAKGKSAEDVGKEAGVKLLEELRSGMAIDRHMGDMMILYMAIAGGLQMGVSSLTLHAETMIWLTEKFFNIKWNIERMNGRAIVRLSKIT